MRKRKGALLRISIEIETTKKFLFYLLAQSVSVYPTSNVGTLVTHPNKTDVLSLSQWTIGRLTDRSAPSVARTGAAVEHRVSFPRCAACPASTDRKSTRLNSSH